jgi:predicted CopG family antitoxin
MSTKTIAIDAGVYARLAKTKRESESFSKAIARMLESVAGAYTGGDVLAKLPGIAPLPERDAESMLNTVRESRNVEAWPEHDLS